MQAHRKESSTPDSSAGKYAEEQKEKRGGRRNQKTAQTEQLEAVLTRFSQALATILHEPGVRTAGREFAKQAGAALFRLAEQSSQSHLQHTLHETGRAAQDFARDLLREYGLPGSSSTVTAPAPAPQPSAATAVPRPRPKAPARPSFSRVDPTVRAERWTSAGITIAWSFILLILFNYFSDYVAYYHYEVVNKSGQWLREPLLTTSFAQVLPILNAALSVAIGGSVILILVDRPGLQRLVDITIYLFALGIVGSLLFVFPFDFGVVPVPLAPRVMAVLLAVVLAGASIGLLVGLVVKIVRLAVFLAQK